MAIAYANATLDPPRLIPQRSLAAGNKKWAAGEIAQLLEETCKQVLERSSDVVIEASFAAALQSGALSVRDVVLSLALSDEWLRRYSSPDAAATTRNLYLRLLAREGDAVGLAGWAKRLPSMGLPAVAASFCSSAEYLERFGLDVPPNPRMTLHQTVSDAHGPLKSVQYEITFANGEKRQGQTSPDGVMHEERAPMGPFQIRVLRTPLQFFAPPKPPASAPRTPAAIPRTGFLRVPLARPEPARAFLHVDAKPARVLAGGAVVLLAELSHAKDGDKVIFRVFKAGAHDKPAATLEGSVSDGSAHAEWRPTDAKGSGKESGLDYADYDIEAECAGAVRRSPDKADFRVFSKGA